uniref:MULE transposase domain-containing protein n=1 Tax=Ditylenchus dipsaci TaxID=166011 RepID=A0A915DY42_9BILA
MMNQEKGTYRKLWREVAGSINNKNIKVERAHFDCECGAFNTFKHQFPDVKILMCTFHVKQAINKKIQKLGLSVSYRDDYDLQDIVRMLGAIQLAPTQVYNLAIQIIQNRTAEKFGEYEETSAKVETLIRYFREQWMELGEFFSLHGMVRPKTTNTAESYHGKQRHHFRKHCKLGEFILDNAEEENAGDVHHNRQPPRQQSKQSAVNAEKISIAQSEFDSFFACDVSLAEIQDKLAEFLIQVGHQMGYNGNAYWELDENCGDSEKTSNAEPELSVCIFDQVVESGEVSFAKQKFHPPTIFVQIEEMGIVCQGTTRTRNSSYKQRNEQDRDQETSIQLS